METIKTGTELSWHDKRAIKVAETIVADEWDRITRQGSLVEAQLITQRALMHDPELNALYDANDSVKQIINE
jgi:hypothetical protein